MYAHGNDEYRAARSRKAVTMPQCNANRRHQRTVTTQQRLCLIPMLACLLCVYSITCHEQFIKATSISGRPILALSHNQMTSVSSAISRILPVTAVTSGVLMGSRWSPSHSTRRAVPGLQYRASRIRCRATSGSCRPSTCSVGVTRAWSPWAFSGRSLYSTVMWPAPPTWGIFGRRVSRRTTGGLPAMMTPKRKLVSGSRPFLTAFSWAKSRLAAILAPWEKPRTPTQSPVAE